MDIAKYTEDEFMLSCVINNDTNTSQHIDVLTCVSKQ